MANINKVTLPDGTTYNFKDDVSGYSDVEWTQKTTSGTNIADITIDGVTTNIYAPNSGGGSTPNDGTLTIQRNNTTVQTFNADQSTNVTADIKVPNVYVGYSLTTNSNVKAVTLYDDTGFSYTNGTTLIVYFHRPSYTGSDLGIELKIGYDQATYGVYYGGVQLSASNEDIGWSSASTMVFTFRSSEWYMLGNLNTIPTVGNGTLTIQKNGTQVATFRANQGGNATANITVPTEAGDISYSDQQYGTQLAADNVGDAISSLDYTISGVSSGMSNKQDTLVSGTNIKTVAGQSLLGSGDVSVYTQTQVNQLLSTKQNELTAGTNITISNNTISATGTTVHWGYAEPSASLGNDGDLYILLES